MEAPGWGGGRGTNPPQGSITGDHLEGQRHLRGFKGREHEPSAGLGINDRLVCGLMSRPGGVGLTAVLGMSLGSGRARWGCRRCGLGGA